MVVTGPVAKGQSVASGQTLYLKSDVAGPPTDAEFTTLSVTNITDALYCYNSVDTYWYTRSGGAWIRSLTGPIKTKAGVPVDADFSSPTDGLLELNTSNLSPYIRSGGTWYSQQLRRHNLPAYICWFDGTNYRADSMTGGTDYSSTVSMAPPLNSAFAAMATAKRGGWVHVRAGDYPMGTASPAVTFGMGSFRLTGEGASVDFSTSATFPTSFPATRFLVGANTQTLFQGTSGKNQPLLNWDIEDISFHSNSFTGSICIDMTNSAENETNGTLKRVGFTNLKNDFATQQGSFATGIIVDGQDDVNMEKIATVGSSSVAPVCTSTVVHADMPSGDIAIRDSVLINGTLSTQGVSVIGNWQYGEFGGGISTFDQIQLDATNTPRSRTHVHDLYWGFQLDCFKVAGFAAGSLLIKDCYVRNRASTHTILLGGGTLDHLYIEGGRFEGPDLTGLLTDSAANTGRFSCSAKGVEVTGYSSIAPFTINSANALSYFSDPGYTVTTPTFPLTGVDQQNNLPFPITAIITAVGGGLTAYGLTDPAGTLNSFTKTINIGDSFYVGPGSKIRFTITSGTPTWKWYGINQ